MLRNTPGTSAYSVCAYVQEVETDEGYDITTKSIELLHCEKELFESIRYPKIAAKDRIEKSKKAIDDILHYDAKLHANSNFRKPNLNVRDCTDSTPLIAAACYGRTEIAHLLLEAKANPHIVPKDYGYSALMWAALYNHDDIVTALIKLGVDLNCQDESGDGALFFAVLERNFKIVESLCEAGVDLEQVNEENNTILDRIIPNSDQSLHLIATLLKYNATINNPSEFFKNMMLCDQRNPQVLFCLEQLCMQERSIQNSKNNLMQEEFKKHEEYLVKLQKVHKFYARESSSLYNDLTQSLEPTIPLPIIRIIEQYAASSSTYNLGFFKPKEINDVVWKLTVNDRSCSLSSCVIL